MACGEDIYMDWINSSRYFGHCPRHHSAGAAGMPWEGMKEIHDRSHGSLDLRLLLANVRLQENKLDETGLRLAKQLKIRDCYVNIFKETCLHHNLQSCCLRQLRQCSEPIRTPAMLWLGCVKILDDWHSNRNTVEGKYFPNAGTGYFHI